MDHPRYSPPQSWPSRKTPKWFMVLLWIVGIICLVATCQLLIALASQPEIPAQDSGRQNQASPVPSPTPGQAEQEQYYGSALVRWTSEYSAALGRLSELNANQIPDDSSWKREVVARLAAIHDVNEEIAAYSVPPKYAKFHTKLRAAAEGLEDSANLYAKGIDTSNIEIIKQATSKILQASAIVNALLPEPKSVSP